jgi:hypothetical protein
MNTNTSNKDGRRLGPWTALLVLTVLLFFVPTAVLAATYGLSQDCAVALVGSEHTITATLTDNGGNPVPSTVIFWVHDTGDQSGANDLFDWEHPVPVVDGVAQFTTYIRSAPGEDSIKLMDGSTFGPVDDSVPLMQTTWTSDADDPGLQACMGSSEPSTEIVQLGGRGKLNINSRWKWGTMSIMVCSDGELDLYTVVPESVTLAGVAPVKSIYKDRKLCPGGQDGYVDLTLMFKNRDMVKAVEESVGDEELADGDTVELEFSGTLDDGTAIEGTYALEIINKNKHRKHNAHKTFKCKHKVKKHVKAKKWGRR